MARIWLLSQFSCIDVLLPFHLVTPRIFCSEGASSSHMFKRENCEFVKVLQLLWLGLGGFILRRLNMYYLCFGFFWDGEVSRPITEQHHICTDLGPGSPYLGTSSPVCVYVYLSHRLRSWHVQSLFYSFMASSQSHQLPCRALYLSMFTRRVLTLADCFKRKNWYLLCAGNWRSHGSLKATLKKASSASFFSPIWLSNRGFHQRKKLSLPFMNQ